MSALDQAIRAGIAIFNAGDYHTAHDAWEDPWLTLETDTPPERFLHGLIQYTAAVYHAYTGNTVGAMGLAESARHYLDVLPGTYRHVDLVSVRHVLAALEVDPSTVASSAAPPMVYGGDVLTASDLTTAELVIAGAAIAEARVSHDDDVIMTARTVGQDNPRIDALLRDYVEDIERRPLIFHRLAAHVERESRKDADLDGLFDGDHSS